MALRKEDYANAGRISAQQMADERCQDLPPMPYARVNQAWQARAWWEAYDAEMERLGQSKIAVETVAQVAQIPVAKLMPADGPDAAEAFRMMAAAARSPRWPRAAEEHLHQLRAMRTAETNIKRRERLVRAIQRLCLRHGWLSAGENLYGA